MVCADPVPWQPDVWRSELKDAVTSVTELGRVLGLPLEDCAEGAIAGFPLRVPRPFVARMRRNDPDDPLLRQVLPTAAENESVSVLPDGTRFSMDPLRERNFARAPALIQKYRGRALLIATPACAVHCRYCFRKHFPYEDHRPDSREAALAALREDDQITEVILSGGDPLVLTDASLGRLVQCLDPITSIERLRIHTRLPIVLPSRITRDLLDILVSTRLRVIVVVHSNHPQELDSDTARAFACLRGVPGVTLLNQSVLLRGVNDRAPTLCALSERLFEQGVLPYYLHMPDAVVGTHGFHVTDARARQIHDAMGERLPGYLLPKLVREEPGRAAKTVLA
ncbi:MAG: EF-P beta-lysylation protein EpmB [Gammaproteobacteria bacterium]|nr:EF-P beta-lysylation protein EpmB [Gammaproteobacteria bacterium]